MKKGSGLLRFLGLAAVALAMITVFAACGEEKKSDSGQPAPVAGGSNSGAMPDACKIVTQEDASKLFGKPAVRDEGVLVVDPNMKSECIWTWDSPDADNQLLQFRVWNGTAYYAETGDSFTKPIDLGEKGHIRVHEFAGVDIEWLQGGKTISLSYSTVGKGVPDPTTKVEEVKQLAKKVEGEL